MGFDYFCFHDFDLIQEASTLAESEKRLLIISDYIKAKQKNQMLKFFGALQIVLLILYT